MKHTLIALAILGCSAAPFAAPFAASDAAADATARDEYAFFSQWTVASHENGSQHNWPNIAALSDGRILLVWTRLTGNEYAVVAAFSNDAGCSWTRPQVLIDNAGLIDADPSILVSAERVFVSCTAVKSDGINTSATWCVRSEDDAESWSEPYVIPMNRRYTCGKTHRGLRLASGTLLMGYSWDVLLEEGGTLEQEGQMDLRAGVMRSTDNGETWFNGGDTHATFEKVSGGAVSGTDEPALVELEDNSIYMLMRTGASHLYEARSTDEGQTWQDVQPSPLRGSNAPAALSPFKAGDKTGIFVVWDNAMARFPLCAAASFDGGRSWSDPRDIGFPYTGGQASYPSCVQTQDGTLLAVWQQDVPGGRDVRLARFSLAWLLQEEPRLRDAKDSSVRLPDDVRPQSGYTAGQDPQAATPSWRMHQEGGRLTVPGALALAPMGGYYIDNRPEVWDGEQDKLVEVVMRVTSRDAQAPGNHSAAELWIGGPRSRSSCRLLFREDAVAFNSAYSPCFNLDATESHAYRILTNLKQRKAVLFLDDDEEPVLATALGSVEGYDINRILFGDSGGAKNVSGTTEWKSIRWADVPSAVEEPPSSPAVTIACFGDSTTAPRGPLLVFAGLIQEELRAQGLNVNVVNAGGGGNTTAMARERFERDVLSKNPQIVTLSFGINDSVVDVWKDATESRVSLPDYEENLRHFIRALREREAEPILMTPNPLLWTPVLKTMYGKPPYDPNAPDGFNVTLKTYAAAVRRIAETEDVPLIDTFEIFSSGAHGPLDTLLLDGMHPNDGGHQIIAGRLTELLSPMLADASASE